MTADAAFWDKIADSYAAQAVGNPEAFDRKTDITLSHLTLESTVLDIGCGTGSFALRLAPHVRAVHGLDASSEMVRIAKEKSAHVDNITFHTGPFDASFTALQAEQLDMVCAYSLLHLVRDRNAALTRMFSLLKPGGVFVSSTECLGGSWVPYFVILPLMRWVGKAPYVSVIPASTVLEEMRIAGFVDVERLEVGASPQTAFIVARKPQ